MSEMKLLIVESPSKAKTIEKYLAGEYTVRASVGHIRDLPKSSKKAIDIEGGFIPMYEISKDKHKVINELLALTKKATEVILATDQDREGEAIAWHLQETLKLKDSSKQKVKRAVFNEITKDAIEESLKHLRDVDMNLKSAQEARRVLDRLFGYGLSALIWKKVRYGLSAGRVQSPALRIIAEREREIQAFKSTAFYVLSATFLTEKNEQITLNCSEEPTEKHIADDYLKLAENGIWSVKEIKESEQKRSPKAPFTTSTLQQTASTRLGFSPSKTMMVAQKLYEKGFISYMRTDSTSLSKESVNAISKYITKNYGQNYLENRVFKTKSKNAQEAHEAIRPTKFDQFPTSITEDEKDLYELIQKRTIASQMTDAKLLKTKIIANVDKNGLPDFSIVGSRLMFDGFLKCDKESIGEDVILPEVKLNEKLKLQKVNSEEKFTEPPNRFSEAGLIKELEARGIGRPSTYASIIRTIEERNYVSKQGKTLFPSETGMVVSGFLEENFANYISDEFTALMEDELDEIAEGKREYTKTLSEFYYPFTEYVKTKNDAEKITTLGDVDPSITCPICQRGMVKKLSKHGTFLSCSRFPECTGARTNDGEEMKPPEETGEMCPKCGEKKGGKLVLRQGRFGTFISCSLYPKCKFIKSDEEQDKKNNTGIKCPSCSDGTMIEKRGRFGIFYACSNYPDCKNAIKTKPTGNICPMCSALMMEGTKTIPERCSNKTCPNHRPDKIDKLGK